ncbi:MAG: GNAT family N-acetyltransferase [Bacteroidales bacterium]
MDILNIRQQASGLWKDCFGDDDAFISRYLDYAISNSYFYYSERNKLLVSFLSLIPVSLESGNNRLNGYYLYGVATAPEFRGQGEGKKLFAEVLSGLKYDFVITIPASESLFRYYKNQGFDYMLERGFVSLPDQPVDGNTEKPEQIFPDEPQVLFAKEAVVNARNNLKWSYNHYLYLFGEYERDESSVLFFRTPEKDLSYLVIKQEDTRCLILDTNLNIRDIMPALSSCTDLSVSGQVQLIMPSGREVSASQPYASVLFAKHIGDRDLSSVCLTLAMD